MQAALGRLGLLGAFAPLGPTERASVTSDTMPLDRERSVLNVPLNMEAIMRAGEETKKESFLS